MENCRVKEVYDTPIHSVEVLKEDRRHNFKVELSCIPYYDRPFFKYQRIIRGIVGCGEFAFFRGKDIQPILDEISKEELIIEGY